MLRVALTTFAAFTLNILAATAQDMLFKLDGEQVEVRVLEITPSEVKYKLTSNPEGPTYVLPKKEIYMVEYANGSKEVFGVKPKPVEDTQPPKVNNEKRYEEKEYRSRKGGGIAGVIIGSALTVVSVPLLIDGIFEVSSRNGKPTQAIAAGFTTLFGIIGLASGIDQLVKASELKIRLMNSTSSLHISPELMDTSTYNGTLIRQGGGIGVQLTYRF